MDRPCEWRHGGWLDDLNPDELDGISPSPLHVNLASMESLGSKAEKAHHRKSWMGFLRRCHARDPGEGAAAIAVPVNSGRGREKLDGVARASTWSSSCALDAQMEVAVMMEWRSRVAGDGEFRMV